jgi:hypothetical protein
MLGFRLLKAAPTEYVAHRVRGRVKHEGIGLSFLYYAPTSTVVRVPVQSADVPYAFALVTGDYQSVTVQGTLTYRVADPARLAGLLDFRVDAAGRFVSEDPDQVGERLVHAAEVLAAAAVGRLRLREALAASEALTTDMLAGLRRDDSVTALGVEVMGLHVLGVRPAPELARALEAAAREALQRGADEAVYARRNAAVEQERVIQESELATELALEAKKRDIREAQLAADIAVETGKIELLATRTANERQEAETRAYALETSLRPLKDADWKTLLAASAGGSDPKLMIALAFRELAENATKIGELNVSPDLLRSLVEKGR